MKDSVYFWRGIENESIERLVLCQKTDAISASSTLLGIDKGGGFRIDHHWHINPDWRAMSIMVERWDKKGYGSIKLKRVGIGWHVNDEPRPDLDGTEAPDLSVTPFCNTFPIRKIPKNKGASLLMDIAYIDGSTLTVTRSKQHYERCAPNQLKYTDLGIAYGFEANLHVDKDGLVLQYEHLFERVKEQ